MSKERQSIATPETVISIIGPGMKVVGDLETDGTVRIEGSVKGNVRAGKAVVIGKDGSVEGTVATQDAVVSGRLKGKLTADSRLELQATSRIEGEVNARRMQLEEGAMLNGTVHMGERKAAAAAASDGAQERPRETKELVIPARAAVED
jgi:cytoskeletal protein CcmA (bactofilin family)